MRRRHAPAPAVELRRAGPLDRWAWPVLAVGSFVALAGYIFEHNQSDRGWMTVALAAAVITVLTVRRAAGARALLRTLAEYALVAVLAVSLATLGAAEAPARSPAHKPARDSGRSGLAVLVEAPGNVRDWIAERWQEAGQKVSQRTHSTPPPGGSS
jgi:hypothetical protein